LSLWIVFAAVLLVTLFVIVLPVIRAKSGGATDHNAIVYQDQLVEIDSDVERGLLSNVEAEALKAEINRRLDKSVNEITAKSPDQLKISGLQLGATIAIIVIIPLAALGLYRHLGSPNKPDLPFAERKFAEPTTAANAEMNRLVSALKERMADNPDKIDGWLLLGRSLVGLARYGEASEAFKNAFKIAPTRAEIAASVAETGFMAEGGKFTQDVRHYFQTAQKLNPLEHKALYYLGLDFAQQKNYAAAIQHWVDLVALSPAGAPWLDTVRRRLVDTAAAGKLNISDFKPRFKAAPGPTAEDVKAAEDMSNTDRQAFIRGMVARLAERLKNEPNDLDGWRRLARAYTVLGQTKKAAEAEARIKELEK
jgi:cytochrome c-type biogenesis protein CcmH